MILIFIGSSTARAVQDGPRRNDKAHAQFAMDRDDHECSFRRQLGSLHDGHIHGVSGDFEIHA